MQGDTPWKKYLIESDSDRQKSFEDRCLAKVYTTWGASKQQLNALRRVVAAGSGDTSITCDWFNYAEAFPVKLSCVRLFREATLTGELKRLMGSEKAVRSSAAIQAMQDLRESYDDEAVGVITRFVDFHRDIIMHTLPLEVEREKDFAVLLHYDGMRLMVQPLEVFIRMLRAVGVAWTPRWISKGAEIG